MEIAKNLFLQGLMSRKVVEATALDKMVEKCCERAGRDTTIETGDLISHCNKQLLPLSLKIVKHMCETTGKQYFALINIHCDKNITYTTKFLPKQLELYTHVLDKCTQSDNGTVSSTTLLNSAQDELERKFNSKSEVEETICLLLNDGWLERDKKSQLFIGARSHMEMSGYIRSRMQKDEYEMKTCALCKALATMGANCANLDCRIRMHPFCAYNHSFKAGFDEVRCMKCKTIWPVQYTDPNAANISTHKRRHESSNGQSKMSYLD
eukprot:CFRG4737T1